MHVSGVNWQCCSSSVEVRWFVKERGRRKVGTDSQATFAAELVSGDGDGPTPSSWLAEARCRTQMVASLLQPPLHAAQKLHIPIRGPAFCVPTDSIDGQALLYTALVAKEPSPLRYAHHVPRWSPKRPRCCHTTQRVGTQHDAVRTPDLRACVNPVLCPSFPSTSAQTASSPKLSDYWTMPTGPE